MKKTAYSGFVLGMILLIAGAAMAEDITIVGTGAGMSLLKSIGDAFTQKNQDIKIIIPESIGSSGGIKSVGTDKYKIGRISRGIKDNEKQYALKYLPFAKLPVVFFTHKSLAVKDLNPQQICDIYSGKTTNWKDIGGADDSIKVIRRQDGDSSFEVLSELLQGFKDIKLTDKSKTTFTDQETLLLAEQKAGTIAFGTYENARTHNLNVLTIAGKKPTDQDYPYCSVLALIFKEENNSGNIKKFTEFVKSADAIEIIKQAGGLPY